MSRYLDDPALISRLARHGDVRRVEFEVQAEHVSFSLRGERVLVQCTCALDSCDHVTSALAFLGEGAAPNAEPRPRSSLRPPPPVPAPSVELSGLANALEELILAVARAGVASPDSPSIRAAFDQLAAQVGTPVPLGLSRFTARLSDALAQGEVGKIARLLDAARSLAEALATGDRSSASLARLRAWFGGEGTASDSLTDATLVEVARERLAGVARASIERRYLLDLATGEAFKEERRVGEHEVSVGPCPRVVHVAFAEVESGSMPRGVRLLQYTVSPQPSDAQWQRLGGHAVRSVRELMLRHGDGARAVRGQAEPFVLFAPRPLDDVNQTRLCDETGEILHLSDESEASFARVVANAGGELLWVTGRLIGLARGLVLRPTSALLQTPSRLHLCRMT